MAIHVALTHRTQYRYSNPVGLGPHIVRLRPAPHCRTPILAYSLRITPEPHFINWQQDPFGNFLARIVVPGEAIEFSATVDLVADMAAINPFDFFVEDYASSWPFSYDPALAAELQPYLEPPPNSPLFDAYVEKSRRSSGSTIDFVTELNRRLARDIGYQVRMEPGVQTPEQTLKRAVGSCRDSGWLLVQISRRLGLAARFVSGYLVQLRTDAPPEGDSPGPVRDFTDLHAWAEVYIPGAGWIGLDPTSGLLAGEGHIPLAATPSPTSAAPITGTHGAAEVDFSVVMRVERIRETPRVTRPYSEETWQAIVAAGTALDERLGCHDVRLTVGGEPTFVALTDAMAPEWNTAALGPTKHALAHKLALRLLKRFAPGGLLHHGHGKWYPGETAARWAIAIYWRDDGEPLCRDPGLLAQEDAPPATITDAEQFTRVLCQGLGLQEHAALPAYEDAAHYALVEQKLPLGISPTDNALADPVERERLVKVFERGLGSPSGYVIPLLLSRSPDGTRRLRTEHWTFKRGHLFLVPGDSPLGLRLPLAGLREITFEDYPHVLPADPFAAPREMAAGADLLKQVSPTRDMNDAPDPVRTALAVELRDGRISVFLPPLADGEDYATLIAAIENASTKTQKFIRLEGYAPPYDPRISAIKVTPDPGVIEVNVHPATSWKHAVDITTTVYEEAAAIGLSAEKFRLDGRHVATGGGNHIVLGGRTPADSPFLRRPDLLGSMIAYWQNHPALSYLFAGQFVGPTSQAPRIDEARHDSLYELEIALRQVPEAGGSLPPWLIDRLFRNLLVDATGNTHRAEICIDKLYAPEGPMGRLGLVELRAFEMTPHPRMSLAQQLLVRALVARFWEQPYRKPFVRWGTALHDRFMLPHFLWSDLQSVIDDLRAAGLPLETGWFAPHLEFRFPVWGRLERAGLALEIREALEPWLVLGEQSGPGASTRTVDSSLERLQVLVSGVSGDRYAVTCNGYRLPLAPTEQSGQTIAGVRFRAWPSPEGFHPTIAPHVPLTFDIIDTWTGRSIGGCRYHAAHPGGRNFQTPPVNALEAEGRRLARFEAMGHSPGPCEPRTDGVHPDFPLTLDLRQVERAES